METVKAKIKGTNAILEGCVCDDSFFVSVDRDIFERYALCEVEICKDSLQVQEFCKENQDSFTSLKEAAEEYAYRGIPDEIKQNVKPIADEIIKQFIAGAKWMRKKDVEDMYMSDNRHFLKCYEQGKVDMRVEMMKDAIHYVVQDDLDSHGVSYNIPFIRIGRVALKPKGIGVGDKVKIIIVKE